MKLFLDANVLFAAAATPKGRAQRLFQLAEAGLCELCASPYVLDEVRRNLQHKPPGALVRLHDFLSRLQVLADAEAELVAWAQAYLPAKDAPVLAAAVASRADALVTGDRRHFGGLYGRTLKGVALLGLREALERVLND